MIWPVNLIETLKKACKDGLIKDTVIFLVLVKRLLTDKFILLFNHMTVFLIDSVNINLYVT